MQQRQLRLGDILDDYCPRERRVTNHAVVAMVGPDVKQTRCTTCDADHEYRHAKVPRQRRKSDAPAVLYAQVAAGAPKRVVHDQPALGHDPATLPDDMAAKQDEVASQPESAASPVNAVAVAGAANREDADTDDSASGDDREGEPAPGNPGNEDGPVHRQLIRATLPRSEGQPPPQRPAPDFTIRQPAGRPGRFRPRPQHGGGQPFGNPGRSNGNAGSGSMRGGGPRPHGHQGPQGPQAGRPPSRGGTTFRADRHGAGRKRSK
jgi:hypothetical protein